MGVASCNNYYDEIGSGTIFAEYIYSRLDKENLNGVEALNTVLYIVEEIKKIDPNCGGPTTVSILYSNGNFFKYKDFDKIIDDRAKILQNTDDKMKLFWQKMIRNPFKIPEIDGDGSVKKEEKRN